MNSTMKWAKIQDQLEYTWNEVWDAGGTFCAVRSGDVFSLASRHSGVDRAFSKRIWFNVEDMTLEEIQEKLSTFLRETKNFFERKGVKPRRKKGSWVSTQNQLKPFLTPTKELEVE